MWSERTPIFRRMLTCMQQAGRQEAGLGKSRAFRACSCFRTRLRLQWYVLRHVAFHAWGTRGRVGDLVMLVLDDIVEVAGLACTGSTLLSCSLALCERHVTT